MCQIRWPLATLALFLQMNTASAQLQANRLYYGKDQAIPMTVAVPEGKQGQVTIALLKPQTAAIAETSQAAPGVVDLAALFPNIWKTDTPSLRYAQLLVGEEKVGPAVVLQPMLTPSYARTYDAQTGKIVHPSTRQTVVKFDPSRQIVYSGLRAYTDKHVVFETSLGDAEFRLRPDMAPNTVFNFRHLVEGGFYTQIPAHRILPDFVVQVGDPTGTGAGGPGYMIDLEPSALRHDFGVLSMARSGDPNSNGSQVFICLTRQKTQHLDGQYTSFAEAVDGRETIQKLGAAQASPATGMPRLVSARLVDAPPYGTGPEAIKLPTFGSLQR